MGFRLGLPRAPHCQRLEEAVRDALDLAWSCPLPKTAGDVHALSDAMSCVELLTVALAERLAEVDVAVQDRGLDVEPFPATGAAVRPARTGAPTS